MLKEIKINNFRSCKDIEITDVSNFLILVGRNGVGKTNILRAINWLARQVGTGGVDFESIGIFDFASVEVELEVAGYQLKYSLNTESEVLDSKTNPRISYKINEKLSKIVCDKSLEIVFNRLDSKVFVGIGEIDLPIGETSMASEAILALLPEHPIAPVVASFKKFFQRVSYNPLDTKSFERASRIASRQDFVKWQKNKEYFPGSPSESELRLLDMKERDQIKYEEVVSLLKQMEIISDFEIISYNPTHDEKPGFYFFQWTPRFYENQDPREWSDLSFGTRRLINLFVTFFYQDDLVFMLEQPEDGIHSGLLNKVVPMLRAYAEDRQLFIASHSAEVINSALPNEVRIVDSVEGRTSLRALAEDEMDAACNYLKEQGPLHSFISMIEQ